MSWTLLASAKANGSASAVATLNTTGAKLIVVAATFSGAASISDNQGNTWQAGTLFNATTPNTRFWYCISPTVNVSHQITVTGAVAAIVVSAWNSTNTPQLDSQSTPNQGSGTTSQFGAANFTPASAGCLLIGGAAWASPGYTSGFAAGSGWTAIDAQNYVSGTSYGVGAAYKTQTTATTVPTTEVVTQWVGSLNESYFGIAFTEVAASSLTITNPKAFEVHQRSGTTGSIQISGTVAGAAEDIEASFNGSAFQTIATAVAAGNFSGTLTGQAQGQGTLTVRKKVTTTSSATVANVKIGDVFLVGGDSLGEGRGTNAQSYTPGAGGVAASDFRQDNAWKDGNDPSDTGTASGSHWPLLATLLLADTGVPVAFITTATGGTDVAGTNNTWAKPNAEYSNMQATVTNSTVAGIKAALFQLGPNAVVNANNAAIARATYTSALTTLASNIAADLPGAPPTFVGLVGQVTTGSPPDRRTAEDNIRGGVLDAVTAGAIKLGPNLLGEAYSDGVHPQSDALLLEVAQRWYLSLKEAFYGGAAGSSRGPRVASAVWNGARTQLTVSFDRPLKTGLVFATAPWVVKDNGTAMTVSGVAYHGTNPNAVVLTTSTAATGPSGTTRLTFASGEDATNAVIPKSTDITLPVGGPIQIPAEPVYSYAVAENLATSVTVTLTTDGSTPAANLTGLRWAFFDQPLPNNFLAPTAKGTGGTTNASGVFTASITGTALASGAVGWLVVTDSNGTTTQSPMKAFEGPVVVA